MRPASSLRNSQKANGKAIALAVAAVFVLTMVVVPRWRHAVSCTITGGRWTSQDVGYFTSGCRVKSKTAGKSCTGQLRDECDRSQCDLSLKRATANGQTASGGTCPDAWVKNGYDQSGKFRSL